MSTPDDKSRKLPKKVSAIERTIWIFWSQGLENAPFLVQQCVNSWIVENPTWRVIVIDAENMSDYVHLCLSVEKAKTLSLNHISDLLRLALLSTYGGIWVDATTYCMRSLDEWIYPNAISGFFAYYKPRKDRILSSWFIVAERNSLLTTRLYERLTEYWEENDFSRPIKLPRILHHKINQFLTHSEKTTKYWFSPVITKGLGLYPYFVFHYLFERLIATDVEAQLIWKNTPKISSDGPHSLQTYGLLASPPEHLKRQIRMRSVPVYKLTWKYDHSLYTSDTLLHFLIERAES